MPGIVRFSLVSGVGALAVGGLLGLATVNGLRERTLPAAPIYPRSTPSADLATADLPTCPGCTTYDEGYRWASAHRVDSVDVCLGNDWAYQRGCLAYVEGGRVD